MLACGCPGACRRGPGCRHTSDYVGSCPCEKSGQLDYLAKDYKGAGAHERAFPAIDAARQEHLIKNVPKFKKRGSARFHELLEIMGALHDKKQADYGTGEDPFRNVRQSVEFGLKPWVGALLRANDKMKRLQKVARGAVLENEVAEDSFIDLAVYVIIGLCLYEESVDNK